MKMHKLFTFSLLLFTFFATFAVWAATEKVGDITWTYTIIGNTAQVENDVYPAIPDTTKGAITIPSTLGGNPVTSIGGSAFYNCKGLTSVAIPSSVTNIGAFAFAGCKGLTSVTIPSGVTSIGASAFYDCSGLTSVTIPSSVTSIGASAFEGCSGLTSVTIPSSVTSIDDHAFYNCSGLTSVTIPSSVTSIGASAFRYCKGLTSVTIPSSVTSIGASAFEVCSGLTSVTISEGVEGIGASAFNGCSGLTSVTIPSGVTSIGDFAFAGCTMLESVTVLATDQPEGGEMMFNGCYRGLFAIFVPQDSVENYRGADGWNAYVENIRAIGEERPGSKDSPWEIGSPNAADVKAWTSGAKLVIEGAGAMCDFTIQNKAPWYGLGSLLTEVVIEEGVASIGGFAFNGCSGLTSVAIPSSVTSIGGKAFQGCRGLTSVTIPSSVTSIDAFAFLGCSGLTSVTIPSSVTSIGGNAFQDCSGLTSVTIPSSVTSIGNNAFYNCSRLGSVLVMASDPPTCENGAFNSVASGFVIRVPSESVSKYNTADGWKAYASSIQGVCVAGDAALAWMDGTTFVVEGTGAMYDFASAADVPWAEAVGGATAVTISEGVTHVGKNALAGLAGSVTVKGVEASTFDVAETVNGHPIAKFNELAEALGTGAAVYPSAEPVIPDDKVLVAKEELQAAKAEAVSIVDGMVSLGVTVNTNGNFTAETKDWKPVELKPENVKVENGKIVISIPVDSASGFMILQSGDAKVPNAAVTHEPWYTPIE